MCQPRHVRHRQGGQSGHPIRVSQPRDATRTLGIRSGAGHGHMKFSELLGDDQPTATPAGSGAPGAADDGQAAAPVAPAPADPAFGASLDSQLDALPGPAGEAAPQPEPIPVRFGEPEPYRPEPYEAPAPEPYPPAAVYEPVAQ